MELPVTLEYKLTEANIADLMTVGQKRAYGKVRLLAGYTLPFLAALCVGAVASYTQEFDFDMGLAFGILAYTIGWMVSYRIFSIPNSQMTDPSGTLLGETTLTATTSTVEVITEKSFWRMKWNGFIDIVEGDCSVLLFIDRMQAIVVDNGAFSNDDDKLEFMQLCRNQMVHRKQE